MAPRSYDGPGLKAVAPAVTKDADEVKPLEADGDIER